MRPCILVCSADACYYLLISYILNVEGFTCLPAINCAQALELLSQQPFLAVLLDCNDTVSFRPDAIDLIRRASRDRSIPLIALLPAGNEALYLDLLKASISNIFVSPHPPAQIVHALRALAGMAERPEFVPDPSRAGLSCGKLKLCPQRHRVHYDGKPVVLGSIQFKLLATMMSRPGRIFSREELIEAAWAPNVYVEPRTVDVHMGRLRGALGKVAGRDLIRTVRGAGYGLNSDAEASNA